MIGCASSRTLCAHRATVAASRRHSAHLFPMVQLSRQFLNFGWVELDSERGGSGKKRSRPLFEGAVLACLQEREAGVCVCADRQATSVSKRSEGVGCPSRHCKPTDVNPCVVPRARWMDHHRPTQWSPGCGNSARRRSVLGCSARPSVCVRQPTEPPVAVGHLPEGCGRGWPEIKVPCWHGAHGGSKSGRTWRCQRKQRFNSTCGETGCLRPRFPVTWHLQLTPGSCFRCGIVCGMAWFALPSV